MRAGTTRRSCGRCSGAVRAAQPPARGRRAARRPPFLTAAQLRAGTCRRRARAALPRQGAARAAPSLTGRPRALPRRQRQRERSASPQHALSRRRGAALAEALPAASEPRAPRAPPRAPRQRVAREGPSRQGGRTPQAAQSALPQTLQTLKTLQTLQTALGRAGSCCWMRPRPSPRGRRTSPPRPRTLRCAPPTQACAAACRGSNFVCTCTMYYGTP